MKKLIPAVVMLLVSALLMATASFAWFSMSNVVTVTGMEIKTKVSSNLLIATDVAGATSKKTDDNFTNTLTQQVKGVLEPVSTANAVDFFYTVDAKADGSKNQTVASSAYIAYNPATAASDTASFADKFSEVYGVTKSDALVTWAGTNKAVAYVDYVFQLKATNTNPSGDQEIVVTQLELAYKTAATDTTKAHRIAFFVEDITSATSSADPTALKATYAVQSSANFDNAGGTTGTQSVVSGTADYTAKDYVDAPISLETVPAGQTKYYKVYVRLWLEGQDTTCNNSTYMALTDEWTLNIELSLLDSTATGVTYIAKP